MPVTVELGSVVKIVIGIHEVVNEKGRIKYQGTVKFEKRSYQDLKAIVKDVAKNPLPLIRNREIKKIKNLPAVRRRMHIQKDHLIELYRRECKRHGRSPVGV